MISPSIIFIGLVWICCLIYTIAAFGLPFGSLQEPGPGFLPVIIGILGIILSSVVLFNEIKTLSKKKEEPIPYIWKVIWFIISITIYVFLLPLLGYIIGTIALSIALFKIMGMKNWIMIGLGGAALGLISYYVIGVCLEVPLPVPVWLQ